MVLNSREIREVQWRLLDMGTAITNVLKRNYVPYVISFGTLLGAVRHKGFIPWDDDFDICLFDDSYERAIAALRRELPRSMFVEDDDSEPLYFHSWAHVKDVNSVAECLEFPQDNLYSHKGISVDLYRITKMNLSEVDHFINAQNFEYIERRHSKGLISKQEYEKRMADLEAAIAASRSALQEDVDKKVYAFPCPYRCKHFPMEHVFPLRSYEFEGATFTGPSDPDSVLRALYGDYMELPPEEKRRSHYSSVSFA